MNKTVLVASDEMRLCNVLKAIKDLEQIFRVCDENVTGEGEHSGIGILSPTKIRNTPDDPNHIPDILPHISDDAEFDKIERMKKVCRAIYELRERWALT
tara:strand:- start:294 stop:590 length:297 start_codon:yes stop_codon:yes gene_type:complete